ncbi:cytochrome P450 3A9-like isoform X2 [Lineus longissimus]|uniref:cytochrome P450 3A9-like isoform X2 n=1 Tax=Lineus longissimus TaxID=88925 RepID=UPI002B4F4711
MSFLWDKRHTQTRPCDTEGQNVSTMAIGSVILTFTACCLIAIYWYKKWRHNVFKQMNLPGPQPNIIFGSLHERPLFKNFQKWTKQYGKTFGYYEGPVPIIVSSDLEFLKQVFVKQFSNFHARKLFPMQPDPDDVMCSMFFATGNRWKRLRAIISPTFSAVKMKQMSPLMNQSIDDMMELLEKKEEDGKPFNVYAMFQGLTLDIIGECAFGMRVESQKNPKDPFLLRCRQIFLYGAQRPILILSAMLLPEFRKFWNSLFKLLGHFREDPTKWLMDALYGIMQLRKKEQYRRVDLLQLMLDAEEPPTSRFEWIQSLSQTDDVKLNSNNNGYKNGYANGHVNGHANGMSGLNHECRNGFTAPHTEDNGTSNGIGNGHVGNGVANGHHKPGHVNGYKNGVKNGVEKNHTKRALTKEEITAQCTLFLLAGYETTSNTMGFAAHELAINPDIQTKLQDEIDEHCLDGNPTYDTVHNMPYLDMVICEVLRKYPLASPVISRMCTESCSVDGIHVPKDMVVSADVWSIHYDPEIWGPVDPEKFHPERFTPEKKATRHPLAWMPFGAGPRNCVGWRFAMMEIKIALCRILRKYSIRQCSETQFPLQFQEGGTVSPRDGIVIKLEARD